MTMLLLPSGRADKLPERPQCVGSVFRRYVNEQTKAGEENELKDKKEKD